MKIALVSPYDWAMPGGVNSHVYMLAEELRGRGNDVRIIVPSSTPVEDPNVIVIGRPISFTAHGTTIRVPVDPRVGRRVRAVLVREQFDVVHLHEPLMPLLPFEVLKYSRRANPNVVNVGTFHASRDGANLFYSSTRWVLKRRFRELDGKIAVSPPAAEHVSRYFPGFYNIIPNGIDISHWDQPDLDPIPDLNGTINILYVGRAEKRKGLAVLLRAFGTVNARIPETRLVVVGPDSRARRRYEASVKRSGRRGVIFVPSQPYDELPRYHRSADIFCSPALGGESQGYVLMEAMSASLPVVASNIDGYASVITHDVDGVLVPPKDPQALANALTTLIRDPERRTRLAAAGRQRVEEYSWPRVTQQLVSYYERLLGTQRSVSSSRTRRRLRRAAASTS